MPVPVGIYLSDSGCFLSVAACVASGNFINCFPDESKSYMPLLTPMFYENLQDNIPSVRSGAAHALASVAKTYGMERV